MSDENVRVSLLAEADQTQYDVVSCSAVIKTLASYQEAANYCEDMHYIVKEQE